MAPAEVTEKLGLHRMRERSWYVHPRYDCRLHVTCTPFDICCSAALPPVKAFSKASNGSHKMLRNANLERAAAHPFYPHWPVPSDALFIEFVFLSSRLIIPLVRLFPFLTFYLLCSSIMAYTTPTSRTTDRLIPCLVITSTCFSASVSLNIYTPFLSSFNSCPSLTLCSCALYRTAH